MKNLINLEIPVRIKDYKRSWDLDTKIISEMVAKAVQASSNVKP